jgi:NAD(P)-dependent dehydrogenase (short-subunit alcohol dehydrogenase family)
VVELAGLGLRVVVNYRSDLAAAQAACDLARERGAPEALPVLADVSDLAAGRRLIETTLERMGRIDVLVNNAGVAPEIRRDILETTPESWDRVLGVNTRGPFFLTQFTAQSMLQALAKGEVESPQIHFITSVSSELASTNRVEYCASKAALSMVARVFAIRLAGQGIGVYEIRPGLIRTDMTAPVQAAYDRRIEQGLIPEARWGTTADVGKAVASIVAGGIPYAAGSIFHVDGGLHVPRL